MATTGELAERAEMGGRNTRNPEWLVKLELLYTLKEWKEITAAARDYDERCRQKLNEQNKRPPNPWAELYRILEKSDLEYLLSLQEDIGFLLSMRERYPGNQEMQDLIREIISDEKEIIRKLKADIEYARKEADRFEKL